MTFLQLLSTHSSQNLTYHCRNSIAHYDSANQNHKKSLKLLGWNDLELKGIGKKRFKFEVIEDGCKVKCLILVTCYLRVNTICACIINYVNYVDVLI